MFASEPVGGRSRVTELPCLSSAAPYARGREILQQFFFISRFMLFSTLKNIEKCPFTYWFNGRWFLQIVDGDSENLYPIYPLFPYDFLYRKCGGGVFLAFYAISNISKKEAIEKK